MRRAGVLVTILILSLSSGFLAAQTGEKPADPCTSVHDFATTDCTLTWHGITVYGAYDAGVGWVSHGLSNNGYNYEGESLVNRNGYQHLFLLAPNNLQQTGLGIRGKEEFAHGWFAVFNASSGINPQSGLLANASATQTANNGLPRASYTFAIDGARAGQPFNDEIYGGISSTHFGTLTFGRQRALGTDAMLLYDPAGGAYAFSYIGYNGTMAGGGDTENSRWDDAIKYRLTYGPVHFGAMYKFVDGSAGCYSATAGWTAATCTAEQANNNAWGFDLGGEYGKKFSADIVYQHYNQAISVLNPLLGPQSPTQPYQSTVNSINTNQITGANLVDPANTVYGIVTDNNGVIFAAKYAWKPFKVFAGYEYIWQNNPQHPLGVGASDQGGYFMSGVEDDNLDSEKLVNIWWTGAKYTYHTKTDITFAWYQQRQNTFRVPPTCVPGNFRSSCAGTLNEGSLYVDHHFSKRLDTYAGIAYSWVTGGLAIAIPHGPGVPYNYNNNFAPVLGTRFAF
jgi:predicted porin